jgi:hypothetical protein
MCLDQDSVHATRLFQIPHPRDPNAEMASGLNPSLLLPRVNSTIPVNAATRRKPRLITGSGWLEISDSISGTCHRIQREKRPDGQERDE